MSEALHNTLQGFFEAAPKS